jgi:hypothetical protein
MELKEIELFMLFFVVYHIIGYVFSIIFFSNSKNISLKDWLFFVPSASIGIATVGLIPFFTFVGFLQLMLERKDGMYVGFIFVAIGVYITFSMFKIMEKEYFI